MIEKIKFFDAFSGYGGFHLGIERAYELSRMGTEPQDSTDSKSGASQHSERPLCIGYSEIDKYASAVYKYHFGGKNYGDITTIDTAIIPDFDLFCGGFPCQAFSIAGKRLGFAETRGTLIYEVFRILKEKQPRFVLLENVKGLLSHDSGRTFKTIISSLAELGYSVEWQVLNAKNFGVPQNRERVFIIGHLGGFSGRQVFPIGKSDESDFDKGQESREQVSNTLRTNYSSGFSNETYKLEGTKIRRLTPTECERLMGLPDGWTSKGDFDGEIKEISDSQRYKLCGNGVVVNVVEEIIWRILWEANKQK